MPGKEVSLTEEKVAVLEMLLDGQTAYNERLREQIRWNAMLDGEDQGWSRVYGGGNDGSTGLTLRELKEWSEKLRNALGNVHMRQGLRLRTNNIWAGGIHYNNDALPSGSGRNVQTKKRVLDPLNQRNFFGTQAHHERESALYTDSIYMLLGDPSDHTLEPYSLDDIGAYYLNPRRRDEIIAYRLDLMDYTNDPNGVFVKEWHYTDLAIGRRDKPGYNVLTKVDEVAPDDRVIFDLHVNTQTGWAFGAPDSLAAYAWAKMYRDFVMNGKVMSDAMAQFAFQVATGSKKETDTAAARIAQPSDAGSTLIGANTLVPLTTAGKGYDFDSGRTLLAIVAAALEVSVVALSSDSTGSAKASTQTLDLPTRLAMESRRQMHIDFDTRVLLWMGADAEKLQVTFSTLDDAADLYRELQALILALDSGLYQPEPIEARISTLLEITGNTLPPDWLIPNTLSTLKKQAKLKPEPVVPNPADGSGGAAASPAATGKKQTVSVAAPDQGRNNPAGKSSVKGNDIRAK